MTDLFWTTKLLVLTTKERFYFVPELLAQDGGIDWEESFFPDASSRHSVHSSFLLVLVRMNKVRQWKEGRISFGGA